MSLWNLRNYELFAHRGYYGDNTIAGFEMCAEKGYHIETDIVQTADGTVFMSHDRLITDTAGNIVYVANMTDAEFKTYWPNAPTAAEFISFMQENPNMLASVSAYHGLDTFLPQIASAGVDNRIIFDATIPSNQQVKTYPNVSWCILYADGMTNEDLDAYRTPCNIVSVQEREDNSDGEFPVSRQWSDVHAGTIADLISKGHTWFCSSVNGSSLDELAETLAEYAPPNYSQKDMLAEIADAIRAKTENDGEIVARNFLSQIRKLITHQETEAATEITVQTIGNAAASPVIKGYYPGVTKLTIDMNEDAIALPRCFLCCVW